MVKHIVSSCFVLISLPIVGCELIYDFEKDPPGAGGASAGGPSNAGTATNASARGGASGSATGTSSSGSGRAGAGTQVFLTAGATSGDVTASGGTSISIGGISGSGNWGGAATGGTRTNSTEGGVSAGGISHTAGTGGIATSSGSLAGSTARGVAGASGVAMLVGGGAAGRSALGGMAGTLASGGSSTGGVATGGAATGGVATGGAPAAVTVARECPTTPLQCGAESCCTTIKVPGGTFKMGRSTAQGTSDYYQAAMGSRENELPEHDATVATFALDKYEVTVGRFREFLSRYDTWHKAIPANPKLGSGTNPNVEASSVASTGWGGSWTVSGNELPADATALRSLLNGDGGNWTDNAEDGHERYPINYLTWYLAFAFCIWDGARLPTEAEWEYAAAGGSENRLFPWIGSAIDTTRANYWSSLSSPALDVGSYPAGVGAFGHMDLAGSMYEWVMDSYSYPYYGSGTPTPCKSCVFFTAGDTDRVIRGGAFGSTAIDLRAAYRSSASTTLRGGDHGFRCARDL